MPLLELRRYHVHLQLNMVMALDTEVVTGLGRERAIELAEDRHLGTIATYVTDIGHAVVCGLPPTKEAP